MRWPSFNSSTFMTDISGKFAHHRQDHEEVSESACAEKADLGQESRVFCTYSPILFSTSYSSVCVWPEVVADALMHNFRDSFRSSCQPWPYSKPTVARRNKYGRIRWTWASFEKEYGEK
jgi:hypothetical protein